jgi:glycosyltransferase involved in cell wall biosynthesis
MITHFTRRRTYARAHAMAKHLVERGHAVSLITIADQRKVGVVESEWDGVRVIEIPDLLWGRLRSGWDLWDLLNRYFYLNRDKGPYDLIHCFETRPITIYPALYYRKRHKLPMVTDWNDWWGRGGIIDEFRPKWYRTFFGPLETYYEEAFRVRADGLTVISSALKQRGIDLGIPPEKICHISGGAFLDIFPFRSIEECRNRMDLPMSEPILGYSSAVQHVEVDFMMKVLSIVAQSYPKVRLLVTGRTGKSLLDTASAHGVSDNVLLTGYVSFEDLSWYLGCTNMFILPFPDKIYNVGRWPNKIGDFMSIGRPMVSNPVGDVKSLLEDHNIGALAQWDPVDFAEKIMYLIENPSLAKQLGENSRQVAETHFDWKLLAGKLESFYYRVLNMNQMNP